MQQDVLSGICHDLNLGQSVGYHWKKQKYDGNQSLCEDIASVIDQRVGKNIPAVPCIFTEKDPAGEHGEHIAAKYTQQIAFDQTKALAAKKAGQSKGAEGKRIIYQYLQR